MHLNSRRPTSAVVKLQQQAMHAHTHAQTMGNKLQALHNAYKCANVHVDDQAFGNN